MSPPGAWWPWTLPGQARQRPRDAQLPRLADGAKLTPARTTSPFPKGHTLPFLLPQQSRQRAPGPSSTRDGTGLGLPPPRRHPHSFPRHGAAREPTSNQPDVTRTWLVVGGHLPSTVVPATPQPRHHLPARQAGAGHSQRSGRDGAVWNQSQAPPITSIPAEPGRSRSIWSPLGTGVPAQDNRATLWVPPPRRNLGASPSSFQDNTVPIKLIRRSCNPWQPS